MTTIVSIGNGHRLEAGAAASYQRARAAGAPAGLTSTYRSWERQAFLRRQWEARVPGYNFALRPQDSFHVKGLAIDVPGNVNDTRTARGWFRRYGKAYGWYPVTNEEWHFEYRSHLDTKKPKKKDNDMPNLRFGNRKKVQNFTKNRWTTVQVTDNNGVSTAFGSVFDTNITIHFQAPTGTQVRGRFYKMNYKTGKRGYTYDGESKVDSPKTTGNTMMFSTNFKGELGPDERLRFEIYTWNDNVRATGAAYRTHEW